MNETPHHEKSAPITEVADTDCSPEELAAESRTSWEKTFSGSLFGYNNEDKKQFEAILEAFIANVEHYAHPDRPGTDEGDKQFYQMIQKLKRLFEMCKEGYTIDKLQFLLDEVAFQDVELSNKVNRLFSKHYAAK
jgi:hypothetical protein